MAVKCPKCQSENPDTVKFCGECGTQLIPSSRDIKPEVTETLKTPVQVLTPGATFAGRYEIIEELGRGGMGLVYKARDTRLDRFVAIKVLPHEKVSDPERKLRFVHEAKAASALNHASIVHIYDIEQAEGIDFIAMEYVEGRTLNAVIGRKGLKLDDALRYAVQVADALTTAHEAGIVHRDLKPGNVMVTGKGQVKVLDFGLAKLTETLPLGQGEPTLTLKPATEIGTIVGTIAYMSPEQAEGKKVDARSDIFSFGSLLYEMVTGRRAFLGESSASTLAAILKENPKPAGQLVESLPREVERLISRCLRKDMSQRFQNMADVKIALEELKEESDSGALTAARPATVRRTLYPKLAVIGVMAIGLAAAIWLWLGRSRPRPVTPLTMVPLTSYPGEELMPSFSPDGTQVAFQWDPQPISKFHIYIKQIGVEPPSRLTDSSAEEISPAWSPDGRFIAFRREASLKSFELVVVPQRGGRERIVAEVDTSSITWAYVDGPYLAWTPDSKWLACVYPVPRTGGGRWGLSLFSVESGERRELALPLEAATGDTAPAFSPDGRFLAFTRVGDKSELFMIRLSEGYIPQGELTRIRSDNPWNVGTAWTPDGKEIVFASGTSREDSALWRTAIGRNATPRRVEGAPGNASSPAISRQGGRLAFHVAKYDTNIWRVDLAEPGRNAAPAVRLIASTQMDYFPVYSLDGRRIAFISKRSGTDEIWVVDSDGSNPVQVTTSGIPPSWPTWSPDGSEIAFCAKTKEDSYPNIYIVNANGGPWKRLTSGPYLTEFPWWSRDGRWIYFDLCGPERCEIWKIPAAGGQAIQITRKGGSCALESPDGKFIFYQMGYPRNITIWRVPVEGGEETKILDTGSVSVVWTLGKKKIYFFAQPDQKGRKDFWAYNLDTGETQKILTVEGPLYYWNMTVSPDEKTILFAQLDEASSDLMLAEDFK